MYKRFVEYSAYWNSTESTPFAAIYEAMKKTDLSDKNMAILSKLLWTNQWKAQEKIIAFMEERNEVMEVVPKNTPMRCKEIAAIMNKYFADAGMERQYSIQKMSAILSDLVYMGLVEIIESEGEPISVKSYNYRRRAKVDKVITPIIHHFVIKE